MFQTSIMFSKKIKTQLNLHMLWVLDPNPSFPVFFFAFFVGPLAFQAALGAVEASVTPSGATMWPLTAQMVPFYGPVLRCAAHISMTQKAVEISTKHGGKVSYSWTGTVLFWYKWGDFWKDLFWRSVFRNMFGWRFLWITCAAHLTV